MLSIKNFAFQGVNGAYSEQAGKNVSPDANSIPCSTFEDMFSCVKNEKAEIAIVPIENSQTGRVADTQRLIPDSDLNIIGEYFLEVNHNLLVTPGTKITDILRIHSHEQGIAQCRNNIIKLNKEMIISTDTAGSAKKISELKCKEDAAIASKLAADIYNLESNGYGLKLFTLEVNDGFENSELKDSVYVKVIPVPTPAKVYVDTSYSGLYSIDIEWLESNYTGEPYIKFDINSDNLAFEEGDSFEDANGNGLYDSGLDPLPPFYGLSNLNNTLIYSR